MTFIFRFALKSTYLFIYLSRLNELMTTIHAFNCLTLKLRHFFKYHTCLVFDFRGVETAKSCYFFRRCVLHNNTIHLFSSGKSTVYSKHFRKKFNKNGIEYLKTEVARDTLNPIFRRKMLKIFARI